MTPGKAGPALLRPGNGFFPVQCGMIPKRDQPEFQDARFLRGGGIPRQTDATRAA
jgi:hypothetical protein